MEQGQPFSGIISRDRVSGHLHIVGSDLYLCQDKVSGVNRHTRGHLYSWIITDFRKSDISYFKIKLLKGKCLSSPFSSSLEDLTSYGAFKKRGKIFFGCGAVSFTVSEMKAFTKVYSELHRRDLKIKEKDFHILTSNFL